MDEQRCDCDWLFGPDKYAAARNFYPPEVFKYLYECEVLGMHRRPIPEPVVIEPRPWWKFWG